MSKNSYRTPHRSSVSHAPFAVINRKDGRCPSCGWSPPEGGVYGHGIRMSLRIHCYREHGLRLSLGDRKRMPSPPTAGIDLDAETAAHLWVVKHALRRFTAVPGDDAVQEGRMGLLAAILLWDSRKCVSFCGYASRIIRQKVGIAALEAESERQAPAGRPLRIMLPSPDPADTPLATSDEVAKAMRVLPDVQRNILECLFRENPETLEGIGKSIGINKERVRQVKIDTLRRLWAELTGEDKSGWPGDRRPKARRRSDPRFGSAKPGRFVVLLDGAPTRMDAFGTLRHADVASVFTDRRMAARLAHNLKVRAGSDKVDIVDADELPDLREEIVESLPSMGRGGRKAMTIAAVRDELERHGPMTTRQIARRLMERDGYMAARHPEVSDDAEERVHRTVANSIREMSALTSRQSGRNQVAYSTES